MVRQYDTTADYEYRKLAHRAPVQHERRIAHPFRRNLLRSEYRYNICGLKKVANGHAPNLIFPSSLACGGNYTSEQGTITSPGYPNSYPLNAECIWILNTSPGNKVTLTFTEFDIESSENCDLDYLEIRENNGIGTLIGVFCGKNTASLTSSSVLWIKFKSDALGTAKGFVAEYNYVGGNELEGPSGRITSPLYPIPYRRTAEISWRVTVDMDSIIRVEFRDLYIENFGQFCFSSIKASIQDGAENLKIIYFKMNLDACDRYNYNKLWYSYSFRNIFVFFWIDIRRIQQRGTNSEKTMRLLRARCNSIIQQCDFHRNNISFFQTGKLVWSYVAPNTKRYVWKWQGD